MTLNLTTDARGVATLTLNRPEKHNALSAELMVALTDAAHEIGKRDDIRVVVLAGEGPTFCAGGDLRWMQDQIAASREDRRAGAMVLAGMLEALNTLPQPLIGRVHGNAFGGGVGLACVCDVAIGVVGKKFGLTETKLGLVPATIGPYVVARIGEAMARRVFMSSRVFDADEAVTLGVIAKAVEAEALDAAIEAEVVPYLSCAPKAVAASKRMARELGTPITQAEIIRSVDNLMEIWEGEEATAGLAAFFGKTKAPWVG